jgi:hypothetical protein
MVIHAERLCTACAHVTSGLLGAYGGTSECNLAGNYYRREGITRPC